MAQFELLENVSFSNPKDGYLKALQVLPELDVAIWKKREIANLLLATKKTDAYQASIHIMFNFNDTVSITLESEKADENTLKSLAFEIFHAIIED